MLDFSHVLNTPGADIQYFQGPATTTLLQWQVWRKPRGAKWIHLLGVGGGGGGSTGVNNATTSGGGAGGSSGGQSSVMIPAIFVPDVLYVQAGAGGLGATTSGAAGGAGTITYVCISPYTTIAAAGTFLLSPPGTVNNPATSTTGGTGGAAVSATTIASMCLAGRGFYTTLGGQTGTNGNAGLGIGTSQAPPVTGSMVTGGTGGGGSNTTGFAGGSISTIANMLGTDFFSLPISGGNAATGSTPATVGGNGLISKNYLFNFGGAGGGGATTTAGGIAGAGGDGAPGCGGGGGGGMNTTNTTIARGGNGGPGFVYIISI